MNSAIPFFEYYPEAQWMDEKRLAFLKRSERLKKKYGGAYDMKGKHNF